MTNGTTTWNYTYDANGMRTSRTNGTDTYTYVYNGSQLVQMTKGSDTLYFTYGAIGPTTVTWNGTTYYYAVNGQGDVVGIFDGSGNCVVTYNWDNAWGYNPEPEGSMANTLGTLNPLRYRNYVYDEETGLYYLQSRYYNPEVCRFINADAFVATGQGMLGNNMFAYCLNNPVRYSDRDGEAADSYAGMAGEEIAIYIYELITGETHPSHQAKQIEQNIIKEQQKIIVDGITAFVKSDDFPKVKATTRMSMGAKDVVVGVAVLFSPDPSPANELAAVRRITFGIIKVTWGFAEFLREVFYE